MTVAKDVPVASKMLEGMKIAEMVAMIRATIAACFLVRKGMTGPLFVFARVITPKSKVKTRIQTRMRVNATTTEPPSTPRKLRLPMLPMKVYQTLLNVEEISARANGIVRSNAKPSVHLFIGIENEKGYLRLLCLLWEWPFYVRLPSPIIFIEMKISSF